MSPNIIEIFDPPPSLDAVVQRFNVKTRKLRTKGNQSFTDFCIAGAEEITKASGSEIAYLPAPCGSLNWIYFNFTYTDLLFFTGHSGTFMVATAKQTNNNEHKLWPFFLISKYFRQKS